MGKKTATKKPRLAKKAAQANLFEAIRLGQIEQVEEALLAGANPDKHNEYGFSPLHTAVSNQDITPKKIVAILNVLLMAGANPNDTAKDGRSVLFLGAEFQDATAPIQLLIDAGAAPDVYCKNGIHITENAYGKKVQKLLRNEIDGSTKKPGSTKATKKKATKKAKPSSRKSKPLTKTQWTNARKRITQVFKRLGETGILAKHNQGYTQSDGFSDLSEVVHERGGLKESGIKGFCYYTRQDLDRAKETGSLTLAFWAAPAGKAKDMKRIGTTIVDCFIDAGFDVDWQGTGDHRPEVHIN